MRRVFPHVRSSTSYCGCPNEPYCLILEHAEMQFRRGFYPWVALDSTLAIGFMADLGGLPTQQQATGCVTVGRRRVRIENNSNLALGRFAVELPRNSLSPLCKFGPFDQ